MPFLKSFFFGIIAAFIAFVLEMLFSFSPDFNFNYLFQEASWTLVYFVLIEELAKIIFIWKIFSEIKKPFSEMNLFYQALFVGLGFALAEASLKILSAIYKNSLQIDLYPALFGTILVHLITSGFIGYLIIKIFFSEQVLAEKKSPKKILFSCIKILELFLISSAWHFFYNYLIIYDASFFTIFAFLLISIALIVLLGFKINSREKTYTH